MTKDEFVFNNITVDGDLNACTLLWLEDNGWYQPYECKTVTVTQSIPNLVDFAYEQGTNLKMLKYFNPWLRGNSLTISTDNSYEIKIPTGKFAKTHGKMRKAE